MPRARDVAPAVFLAILAALVTAAATGGCATDPATDAADAGDPVPDAAASEPDAAAAADASPDPDADLAACADRPGRFDLNDVSFLFPLPSGPAARGDLLGIASSGARGELLPLALFDQLPAPLSSFRDVAPAELRVVAARVDPCFVSAPGGPCRAQLRLVVQPLRPDAEPTRADDAAVHLFYDLGEPGLAELVAALDELRGLAAGRTRCRPLGVHPVMAVEGLTGPYALRLRQAILDAAGATNLARIAIMQLQQPGSVWRFHGFDVVNGELERFAVPRTGGGESQAFSLSDTEVGRAFLDPEPSPGLIPLLFDPAAIRAAPATTLAAAGGEAVAIEDPRRRDTTDTDCVSCHLSQRALHNALAVRDFRPDGEPPYANPGHDLSRPDDRLGAGSQRAFGYFDGAASITPRAVHESAEVADALSGR